MKRNQRFIILLIALVAIVAISSNVMAFGRNCSVTGTWIGEKVLCSIDNDNGLIYMPVIVQIHSQEDTWSCFHCFDKKLSIIAKIPMNNMVFYGDARYVGYEAGPTWEYTLYCLGDDRQNGAWVATGEFELFRNREECRIHFNETVGILEVEPDTTSLDIDIEEIFCADGDLYKAPVLGGNCEDCDPFDD